MSTDFDLWPSTVLTVKTPPPGLQLQELAWSLCQAAQMVLVLDLDQVLDLVLEEETCVVHLCRVMSRALRPAWSQRAAAVGVGEGHLFPLTHLTTWRSLCWTVWWENDTFIVEVRQETESFCHLNQPLFWLIISLCSNLNMQKIICHYLLSKLSYYHWANW